MAFSKNISPALLLALIISLVSECSFSQNINNTPAGSSRFSAGITASHFGYDAAIGVELTLPVFFRSNLYLRLKVSTVWLEEYKAANNRWATYNSFAVAMVYNFKIIDRSKIFFEAGGFGIAPENTFSEQTYKQGVYGLVGLELFILTKERAALCYYLGTGLGYINAYAEKLESRPRYGNGLIFTNGFRMYF